MSESPPTRRSPGQPPRATATSDLQADQANSTTVATQLRNRRAAALRCAPFDDAGHRDPIDILADEVRDIVPWLPFGLSEAVRRAHANDLMTQWGWTADEIFAVLKVQPRVAA